MYADKPSVAHQPDELAEGVLKLTKTLRYIAGIVERGEGRKLADDECVDIVILNYVKKLEDTESIQQEYYKRGWKEAQEHYTMRESGGLEKLEHELLRGMLMKSKNASGFPDTCQVLTPTEVIGIFRDIKI